MDTFIILPDQLFWTTYSIKVLSLSNEIIMFEEPLYFDTNKHKQVLHRASMKYYYHLLKDHFPDINVKYIKRAQITTTFLDYLQSVNNRVNMFTPANIKEWKNIESLRFNGIPIKFYDSPAFLIHDDRFSNMAFLPFYKKIRKMFTPELNKYVKNEYVPAGGSWIFEDTTTYQNRDFPIPEMPVFSQSEFFNKAVAYANKELTRTNISNAVCRYPITHCESNTWLIHFIKKKLAKYGINAELMDKNNGPHFHSCLSSSLNIGLLTPLQVLSAVLKSRINVKSIEPFIRAIAMREYSHILYKTRDYTKINKFGFNRKIPVEFYTGDTQFSFINNIIREVLNTGYLHEAKRNLCLCLFLLHGFSPREIYKWFSQFIDAYPWSLQPHISNAPLLNAKKIKKMSNFEAIEPLWDVLYYNFIDVNRGRLENYNDKIIKYDKMPENERIKIKEIAIKYLK